MVCLTSHYVNNHVQSNRRVWWWSFCSFYISSCLCSGCLENNLVKTTMQFLFQLIHDLAYSWCGRILQRIRKEAVGKRSYHTTFVYKLHSSVDLRHAFPAGSITNHHRGVIIETFQHQCKLFGKLGQCKIRGWHDHMTIQAPTNEQLETICKQVRAFIVEHNRGGAQGGKLSVCGGDGIHHYCNCICFQFDGGKGKLRSRAETLSRKDGNNFCWIKKPKLSWSYVHNCTS